LLHSEMNALDYLTEAPHNYVVNDVNAMAFEEATKTIRGCDVVNEFLAFDILPHSNDWDLEVERTEALLSKVVAMIDEQET
jgi:hypothetical protein